MRSPKKPWKHGKQPGYIALRLTVNICQDEFGNVWSDHTFATPEDEALAADLKHKGPPEIAHALMSEALRREAFMLTLLKVSADPQFLQQWGQASKEDRALLQKKLEKGMVDVVHKTAEKNAAGVVEGVLTMLTSQL